ncbi:senescence/dehydration-associated-like protein, putative [Medicago truncatula]|uniref:Senescence/dehydration-associated-like protein, putative n=1 Tax=Medicago truncatula TaxID=3880 RepID=A0A072UDK4_MEDTR|nr:senescence/dehydration-associated-like protein, putative [Medicago truncatula]
MAKNYRMNPIASSVEFSTKPKTTHIQEEILIQIPECKVYLKNEEEAHELSQGQFTIIKIVNENVSLATIIKIGNNVQFPLTKDEPIVKVDSLHYLFSLPVKDGHEPLSYGVTFPHEFSGSMDLLNSFLNEYSCFSGLELSKKGNIINNNSGMTSQNFHGILIGKINFNQVQNGAQATLNRKSDKKKGGMDRKNTRKKTGVSKNNKTNENPIRYSRLNT